MNKTALSSIEKLNDSLICCRMNLDNVEIEELNFIANYFNITAEEAVFIVIIFSMELAEDSCDLKYIKEYLHLGDFEFIKYTKYIDDLIKKGLVDKKYRQHNSSRSGRFELRINPFLYDYVIENKVIPQNIVPMVDSDIEWIGLVAHFIEDELENITENDISFEYEKLCKRIKNSELQKFMTDSKLSLNNSLLLIKTIWSNYLGINYTSLDEIIHALYPSKYKHFSENKQLKEERHPLITKGLIQSKPAKFLDGIQVRVTESFRAKLKKMGIVIESKDEKESTNFNYKNIVETPLFFSEELHTQISKLEEILEEENYQKVKKRMQEKGMQAGVTTLFFGAPGTGKTECVLQFAKKSKRNVIHVDISETKSMWYGQSEKQIKRIFSEYKEQYQEQEKAPILLLNEADAVLGKRKQGGNSSTDSTENAMQNILLEEMEKFEGILIATTNLAANLDTAFDRRFLFKVKFETPTSEQRHKIWQIKLPDYNPQALVQAANEFELSGGQIQNVVRKLEIDYILNGAYPDAKVLLNLCNNELALHKKTTGKIGF
jgi:SpoVK/Ycf46/Vps4 family AAA+-type ATPase